MGAVLTIIALFASGAWLLVAFIVTALALLGRTLLAAAGNGSWAEVIIDAVALATLGLSGGITGTGARVGRTESTLEEAIKVADEVVTDQRAASGLGRAMSFLSGKSSAFRGAADFTGKFSLLKPLTSGLTKSADVLDDAVKVGGAFQDIIRPMPSTVVKGVQETSMLRQVLMGGPDLANDAAKLDKLNSMRNLVNVPKFAEAAGKVLPPINSARGLIFTGAVVSTGGIVLSSAPMYGPNDFGAENPVWHFPWDFKWFDNADEALTGAIPEPALAPSPVTPNFAVARGLIGK